MTKIIKWIKDYSYKERLKKLGLTTILERRIRDYLNKTFKMINGISNYDRHFFNISSWTGNLLSWQVSKTKSTFANRVLYFGEKIAKSDQKQQ